MLTGSVGFWRSLLLPAPSEALWETLGLNSQLCKRVKTLPNPTKCSTLKFTWIQAVRCLGAREDSWGSRWSWLPDSSIMLDWDTAIQTWQLCDCLGHRDEFVLATFLDALTHANCFFSYLFWCNKDFHLLIPFTAAGPQLFWARVLVRLSTQPCSHFEQQILKQPKYAASRPGFQLSKLTAISLCPHLFSASSAVTLGCNKQPAHWISFQFCSVLSLFLHKRKHCEKQLFPSLLHWGTNYSTCDSRHSQRCKGWKAASAAWEPSHTLSLPVCSSTTARLCYNQNHSDQRLLNSFSIKGRLPFPAVSEIIKKKDQA